MSHIELISMNPMVWESLWACDGDRRDRTAMPAPGYDELLAAYGVEDEDDRHGDRSLAAAA